MIVDLSVNSMIPLIPRYNHGVFISLTLIISNLSMVEHDYAKKQYENE